MMRTDRLLSAYSNRSPDSHGCMSLSLSSHAPIRFLFHPQIAADIRYILNAYDKVIPTVLEIPSKDKPYHEEQDPIMQRVLKLMGSRD